MRWKKVLGIIALLFLIVVIGGVVFLKTYDWNRLKPQIARAVHDATGRELVIDGGINLEVGLTPDLVVENVAFQNAPWGSRPVMARIERLELQLALLPLLSGEVDVKRLVLANPDILIEKSPTGKTNLEFTPPAQPDQAPEAEPREPGGALPAFNITRLGIEQGKLVYRDLKTGQTYRLALARLAATGIGTRQPIELALEAAYNDRPFTVKGTLGSLAAMMAKDTPWPLDVTAAAGGLDLALEGTILDPTAPRGIDLAFRVEGEDLSRLADFTGADIPFAGPLRLTGTAVDEAPDLYAIPAMEAELGDSRLTGSLGLDMRGAKPLVSANLVSERFDLTPFLRPAAAGTAARAPAPDAQGEQTPPEGAAPAKASVFPSEPLPVEALTTANADIELKVDQILPAALQAGGLAVKARLQDGALSLSPVALEVAGGAVKGALELAKAGSGLKARIRIDADGVETGRLLDSLEITDLVERAPVRAAIDLRGQGETVDALMGSLTGRAGIEMQNGLVRKALLDYLDRLDPALETMLVRLFNLSGEEDAALEVNCLVSRFNAASGVLRADPLVADTPYFSVIGTGAINLENETYDLLLRPVPKEEAVTTRKVDAADLSLPVRVTGPLAGPKLAIAKGQAALALGKRFGGEKFAEFSGIAEALLGEQMPELPENPCQEALKAGGTETGAASQTPREGHPPQPQQPPTPEEQVKEQIGNILKDFLQKKE